jgi:hypothetical protein
VIVVLGRPRVHRPEPDGELAPTGLAVAVALGAAAAGSEVELVGAIGDDPEGDKVVVALGRAGVGHAALLRDPAARTPHLGQDPEARPLPRLDAADVELGLRYLPECRVLVIGAQLDQAALAEALEAAAFHGAAVVMVATAGTIDPESVGPGVTLLERPPVEDEEGTDEADAAGAAEAEFGTLVAEYAVRLDRGLSPSQAFSAALDRGAWEPSVE